MGLSLRDKNRDLRVGLDVAAELSLKDEGVAVVLCGSSGLGEESWPPVLILMKNCVGILVL